MTKPQTAAVNAEDVELPIVDLALLRSGTEEDKAEFVRRLEKAMFNVGFFYLK